MAVTQLAELFEQAGCTGTLCVIGLDGGAEIALDADEPMVAASVFKVAVALEAERQFAEGRLDPRERTTLTSENRTPGPVGFSLYQDDVQVSLRDLVPAMMTISDNVATDTLLERVGIDAVNESMAALGLHNTIITNDLHTIVDSLGRDAGFAGWDDMQRWAAAPQPDERVRHAHTRLLNAREMRTATATRTTAREMATLLRMIWRDQAGPVLACRRVRAVMARQLTRHRLASAFARPVRVSAKSGGLAGIVRNEVGVIEYADGTGYAAAVFTRCETGADERPINAAIGQAAAYAVDQLAALA